MSEVERILFTSYRIPYTQPGVRSERCVCGEWIIPVESTHDAISDAIKRHNATELHREWRRRSER